MFKKDFFTKKDKKKQTNKTNPGRYEMSVSLLKRYVNMVSFRQIKGDIFEH